jgi:PKHD-type hydroxylase
MLIRLPHVLSPTQLQRVQSLLAEAAFVNGKLSAGSAAQRVKNNEEARSNQPQIEALNDIVMGNLVRHPVYNTAALPHRVATPFYARYCEGMSYGEHIDDPVMGVGERYRCDIAITVFLNEPQEYDGGELVIQTSFGEQTVKEAGGNAVMYPASSRHYITDVTRGVRLVAVTWVQSLVRDPLKREILYDLSQARNRMLRRTPDAEETAHVDTAYVNLVRLWADL